MELQARLQLIHPQVSRTVTIQEPRNFGKSQESVGLRVRFRLFVQVAHCFPAAPKERLSVRSEAPVVLWLREVDHSFNALQKARGTLGSGNVFWARLKLISMSSFHEQATFLFPLFILGDFTAA